LHVALSPPARSPHRRAEIGRRRAGDVVAVGLAHATWPRERNRVVDVGRVGRIETSEYAIDRGGAQRFAIRHGRQWCREEDDAEVCVRIGSGSGRRHGFEDRAAERRGRGAFQDRRDRHRRRHKVGVGEVGERGSGMHIARLGRGRLQNAGDGGTPATATCGAREARDGRGCSGHDG
jgi:hypothetical protein